MDEQLSQLWRLDGCDMLYWIQKGRWNYYSRTRKLGEKVLLQFYSDFVFPNSQSTLPFKSYPTNALVEIEPCCTLKNI
jgi:hypothetical protein